MTFTSLGNAIRLCKIDFDVSIDIDVEPLKKSARGGVSHSHCAVGRITYSNGTRGYLVYLKPSLTGDEDAALAEYAASNKAFPHEFTTDQRFEESQFESYRRLGYHVASASFRDAENEPSLAGTVERMVALSMSTARHARAEATKAADATSDVAAGDVAFS
jgi:hypothetical protein